MRMTWSNAIKAVFVLLLALIIFLLGYIVGITRVNCVIEKHGVVTTRAKKVVKLPPRAVPLAAIPRRAAIKTTQLILRLNVVEWSPVFEGRSPASKDIGPIIRMGMTDRTIKFSITPLTFNVNGVEVVVQDGKAVLNPGGPTEMGISVNPMGAEKYVLPPGAQFPLVVSSNELNNLINRGAKEIWLNFLLAPR